MFTFEGLKNWEERKTQGHPHLRKTISDMAPFQEARCRSRISLFRNTYSLIPLIASSTSCLSSNIHLLYHPSRHSNQSFETSSSHTIYTMPSENTNKPLTQMFTANLDRTESVSAGKRKRSTVSSTVKLHLWSGITLRYGTWYASCSGGKILAYTCGLTRVETEQEWQLFT